MPLLATGRVLTGRAVLAWLIAGFLTVVAVNGTMIWLALDSWPGLVSETAYQDGLDFNRTLDAGERQKALGWQFAVDAPEGVVEFSVVDAAGVAVADLTIDAVAQRPVSDGEDVVLSVREEGGGRYRASTTLAAGNWLLVVDAHRGDDRFYLERKIYVKP